MARSARGPIPVRPASRERRETVGVATDDVGTNVALRGTLTRAWMELGPFLGLLLITLLFTGLTYREGTFLSVDTWRGIAKHTVVVGTAALGMTMIMIAGGIDLSVGSVVSLVTVGIALMVS